IIIEVKDFLSGKIYFIFEEGDDYGAGIDDVLTHLEDENLYAIYGNHLAAFMDIGAICVDEGLRMAVAISVYFTVHPEIGLVSRPDLYVNPVFAAEQNLNGLTSAWANQMDVTKTVTLGLTQIHGGTANNVIPDKVYIGGSLRFFDVEEGKKALEVVKRIADATAQAHECTVELHPSFE